MFDLNRNVKRLASKAAGGWMARRIDQAELEDYLFCVIEEKMRNGLDEQQAFEQAQQQLGELDSLHAELKRARRSQLTSPHVATVVLMVVAVAGIIWPENEVYRRVATGLLAANSVPLKWLGLVI